MANSRIEGSDEIEQKSRALFASPCGTYALQSSNSTAEPSGNLMVGHSNLDPLKEPQEATGSPSKSTESCYRIPQTLSQSSLEVLSRVGEESNSLARGNVDTPRRTPSTPSSEDARNVPLPETPSEDVPSVHSSIAMPSNSSAPGNQDKNKTGARELQRLLKLYKDRINYLSDHFSHLKKICSDSRHDKTTITAFDYADSTLRGSKQLPIEFETRETAVSEEYRRARIEESRAFMCANSLWPEVNTRIIVVEDIGPTMISLLGVVFELSPEFFAEHLYRSGYRGNEGLELSPSAWRTSNLQKHYVSMEWRRPVQRWRQEPVTLAQRSQLLEMENSVLEGEFEGLKDVRESLHYRLKTTTNIFRPEFAMYTEPDGKLPETSPSGWEERATASVAELDDLKYG